MTGEPEREDDIEPVANLAGLAGAFAEHDLTADLEADHRRELEQEDPRPA